MQACLAYLDYEYLGMDIMIYHGGPEKIGSARKKKMLKGEQKISAAPIEAGRTVCDQRN